MNKTIKILLLNLLILSPILAFAQPTTPSPDLLLNAQACYNGRFIPCDGTDRCPCNFRSLMVLIDNVLNFMTNVIAVPLAIITFTWAGFLLMTTAVSDQRTKAKGMMRKVVIGFVIILSANLIVKTVLGILLNDNMFSRIFTF